MKNQKGITLIALVITIIVMLILVVVTVTFALGEDGIIGNARTGATKQKNASIREAVTLTRADVTMDKEINPDTTITAETVENKINAYLDGLTVEVTGDEATGFTVTSDDIIEGPLTITLPSNNTPAD